MSTLVAELEQRKTYLKASEFARLLNLSKRQIYKMIHEESLPALRFGTTVRLCPRAMAKWLKERTA